jgi:hypothetical protein
MNLLKDNLLGVLISWFIISLSLPPDVIIFPFQASVPTLEVCGYQKSTSFLLLISNILTIPEDSPTASRLPLKLDLSEVMIWLGSFSL